MFYILHNLKRSFSFQITGYQLAIPIITEWFISSKKHLHVFGSWSLNPAREWVLSVELMATRVSGAERSAVQGAGRSPIWQSPSRHEGGRRRQGSARRTRRHAGNADR